MPVFPLHVRPKESYKEPPRSFGSSRDHGARKHAGCDLYAPAGTEVLAVDVHTGRPAWPGAGPVIHQDELDESLAAAEPGETLGTARYTLTAHGDKLFARLGSSITGQPPSPCPGHGLVGRFFSWGCGGLVLQQCQRASLANELANRHR